MELNVPLPIEGARNMGNVGFHALITLVKRLSHKPRAILANVFAVNGATTSISAQRRSSMCNTGSVRCRHTSHSSWSVQNCICAGSSI